jgi:peptide/nickel transport system permease protein
MSTATAVPPATPADAVPAKQSRPTVRLFRMAWRYPQAKVGVVLTLVVVIVAVVGPIVAKPLTGYGITDFADKPFELTGVFGTDQLGRDVLSRFLAGGLNLLIMAVLATAIGLVLGAVVGMVAGYFGGKTDEILMRASDVLLAFPQLVLALLAITVIGPKAWLIVAVIGLTHAPRIARVARQATLGVAQQDFVKAAEMYAVPRAAILGREILPNITGPLMVELGLRLTYSIGYVASLSFLGMGIQPPAADWGLMINENRIALVVQPWGVLLPVIAIALLAIGTNMLSDALAHASAGLEREVEE